MLDFQGNLHWFSDEGKGESLGLEKSTKSYQKFHLTFASPKNSLLSGWCMKRKIFTTSQWEQQLTGNHPRAAWNTEKGRGFKNKQTIAPMCAAQLMSYCHIRNWDHFMSIKWVQGTELSPAPYVIFLHVKRWELSAFQNNKVCSHFPQVLKIGQSPKQEIEVSAILLTYL